MNSLNDVKRMLRSGATLEDGAAVAGISRSSLHRLAVAQRWKRQRKWLTPATRRTIRADREAGMSYRQIETKHGLSAGAVYRALSRKAAEEHAAR